ncbi:MAG TPA: DUF4465 domain-containing protein, partial [Prolixibacteraceae bacterium]
YSTDYKSWYGFAYSNLTDITTAGYTNQYSAITGQGFNGSANYAVCYPAPTARVGYAMPTKTTGFYVTNSTYAYLSMKNGDAFAKKFGGDTGNDPDYFKLMIEGLDTNGLPVDTVSFYLADFRFADNSKDYILNKWTWVDISKLKETRFLRFSLSSSDNAIWGMNTPGFFCIDNFNDKAPTSVPILNQVQANVFPNPFIDHLVISGLKGMARVSVVDISGKTVAEYNNVLNNQPLTGLQNLNSGVYLIRINEGSNQLIAKLIKK